jgi:hypothetical protein
VPSVKNKWVKPGGGFNYTEGVRVKNATGATIPKYSIVQIRGVAGDVGTIEKANAAALDTLSGRLLTLRHDIPAGRYGVATPWIIISANTAAGGAHAKWYVDQGANAGKISLTAPSGAGGQDRVIGYTLGAPSATGHILLADTNAI